MSAPLKLYPCRGVNLYSHPLMKQFFSTSANDEQCEKVGENSETDPVDFTVNSPLPDNSTSNIINLFKR
ncbi:hypothetical protein [uncultured Marinobacter sp.]|uniref:hypothetical protein n=1 Tax=uncultured Marinobacter sp. TaxID=187379 RepID=UPI002594EA31|nr:hypothetical protein [uncultured Marinobacter sp.]